MKRPTGILVFTVFVLLIALTAYGRGIDGERISIVVPAGSIGGFISRLLPYDIDMGKGFSGYFCIKSIEDIRIGENKILLRSHIYGKDVEYTFSLGDKGADVRIGDVDLFNNWEISFRYHKEDKVLYVKPHLEDRETNNKSSRLETLLNILFKGFSDFEYPVKIRDLDPVVTEILGKSVVVNFEVTDIYTEDNRMIVQIKPVPTTGGGGG